tara:strand:+ start:2121 stop:2708 length:588 start_codon:yes stop_codon:yes gene_type:complete
MKKEILECLEQFVNCIKIDNGKSIVSYLDFNYGDNNSMNLVLKKTNIHLKQPPKPLVDIISEIKNIGISNTKIDLVDINLDIKNGDVTTARSILSKICLASSRIAIESRRGPASITLLPFDYYNFIIEHIHLENSSIRGITLIPSEHITNEILVIRKGTLDTPGINFFYTKEDNLGELIKIGRVHNIQTITFNTL